MPLESPNEPPMSTPIYGAGIEITGRITAEYAEILTPGAVAFAANLQRLYGGRRDKLLARRAQRQAELDAGKLPDFLPETRAIRDGDWTCAPYPADIADRRVEITGPVDRKMIVNALNSEVGKMLTSAELREFLTNEGAEAETMTPQQFADLMRLETERWIKVAREANISID